MNTILDKSKTSNPSSTSSIVVKGVSAPIYPPAATPQVKTQISAPSYLFSLKDNDAPPFNKPGKPVGPRNLIGVIMNENEAVEMIAANDADKVYGLKMWLRSWVARSALESALPPCCDVTFSGSLNPEQDSGLTIFGIRIACKVGGFLIQKKLIQNYNISEKAFLVSLVTELIDYGAQRDLSAFKLAVLITIYLSTHLSFKWYYWTSPESVWCYFKEVMIRHAIEDSPDGQEVFTPEECYDIVTHFHTVYLSNLPLVHVLTFGVYRLKLQWPFHVKTK